MDREIVMITKICALDFVGGQGARSTSISQNEVTKTEVVGIEKVSPPSMFVGRVTIDKRSV